MLRQGGKGGKSAFGDDTVCKSAVVFVLRKFISYTRRHRDNETAVMTQPLQLLTNERLGTGRVTSLLWGRACKSALP